MESSQLFDGKSQSYTRGRSGYSLEVFSVLQQLFYKGAVAADIGCGTGIFSQLLIDAGFQVYGVEPNDQMLHIAKQNNSTDAFTPILSGAENIPLPDHSLDLICAAQSFHWFDRDAFRSECDRLLKPDGYILLIWNTKDTSAELISEYQDICRRLCQGRFVGFHNGLDLHSDEVTGFFHHLCESFSFQNSKPYSREKFLNWCLSTSYAPKKNDPEHEAFSVECQNLFDNFCVGDTIILPSRTIIYVGK